MAAEFVIQVPKVAWPAIEDIVGLPVDRLEALVSCICQARPTPDVEDLAEQCAGVSGIPADRVEGVIWLGISLNRLRRDFRKSAEDVLAIVSRSLERSQFPGWQDGRSQAWADRQATLAPLLRADSVVETMSKARQLLCEFQCVVRDTAVLTDVRHIYDESATSVQGALIIQTLVLQFAEGDESRQIHLALSTKDIAQLIAQLTRAQKKADAAVKLLRKAGIPELTPRRNPEP